jgi:hypothetical protein
MTVLCHDRRTANNNISRVDVPPSVAAAGANSAQSSSFMSDDSSDSSVLGKRKMEEPPDIPLSSRKSARTENIRVHSIVGAALT